MDAVQLHAQWKGMPALREGWSMLGVAPLGWICRAWPDICRGQLEAVTPAGAFMVQLADVQSCLPCWRF